MKCYLLPVVLLLCVQPSFSAQYTWEPMANLEFFNATNWSPARTNPQASDTLIFDGQNFWSGGVTSTVINSPVPPAQQYFFGGLYIFKNNIRASFGAGNAATQGSIWYIPNLHIQAGSRLVSGGSYGMVFHLSGGRVDGNLDFLFQRGAYLKYPGVDVYGRVTVNSQCDLLHDGTVGDPHPYNLLRFRAGSELQLRDQTDGFCLRPAQEFLPGSAIRVTGNSITAMQLPAGPLPVLPHVVMESSAVSAPGLLVFNRGTVATQPLQVAGNVIISTGTSSQIYLTNRGRVDIQGSLASNRGFTVNGSTGSGTVTVQGNLSFFNTCLLSESYRDTLIVYGDINPPSLLYSRSRPVLTESKPGSAVGGADSCLLWLRGSQLQNFGYFYLQNQVVVKLDNAAGLNLQYPHDIPFALQMTAGMIFNSGRNIATFTNATASVNGYGSTRFFTGKVKTVGISHFLFPVGKGTMYRPLTTGSATGDFEVEYIRSNPAVPYPQAVSSATPFNITPVNAISELEYWWVNGSSSATAKVYLCYDAAYSGQVDNSNFQDLRIAGHDGSNWGGHYSSFTSYYPASDGSFGWMETVLPIGFFGPLTWGYAGSGPNPLVPATPRTTAITYTKEKLLLPVQSGRVFPNPAANRAVFSFTATADGVQRFVISDWQGRPVAQFSQAVVKGVNSAAFSTRELAPGMYVIRGGEATVSFVVSK